MRRRPALCLKRAARVILTVRCTFHSNPQTYQPERLSSQSLCQQAQIHFGLSFPKHRFSKQRRCQNPITSVGTCATRQIWKRMKQSSAPQRLKTSLATGTRKIACPCLARIAHSRTQSRTAKSVCSSGSFQASLRQRSPLRTRWNYRWASNWLFLREPVEHPAKQCLIHHCLRWTFYWTNSNKPEHRVQSWHIVFTCPRRNHENSHCVEARHHLSARRFVFLSEKDDWQNRFSFAWHSDSRTLGLCTPVVPRILIVLYSMSTVQTSAHPSLYGLYKHDSDSVTSSASHQGALFGMSSTASTCTAPCKSEFSVPPRWTPMPISH